MISKPQKTVMPGALIEKLLGARSARDVERTAKIAGGTISRWISNKCRPNLASAQYRAFCDALDLTTQQRRELAVAIGLDPRVAYGDRAAA